MYKCTQVQTEYYIKACLILFWVLLVFYGMLFLDKTDINCSIVGSKGRNMRPNRLSLIII